MSCRTRTVVSCTFAAALVTGTALLTAGPLNPPAGAVSPTYKTLTEVEPRIAVSAANTPGDADSLFKITQPGSYYLAGNISGVANKHGVEIATGNVTLDLNGFDLVGPGGAGTFDGVSVTVSDIVNVCVMNGNVRNWPGDGVNIGLSFTDGSRVDSIRSSGNGAIGISAGRDNVVTNCSAAQNGSFGIRVAGSTSIIGCTAARNANDGISTLGDCTISDCTSWFNTGEGFSSSTTAFTNCQSAENTGVGYAVGPNSTLVNCVASGNGLNGVTASFGTTVQASTISNSAGIGISIGTGGAVLDCVLRENGGGGITCGAQSVIRGNSCSANNSAAASIAAIAATANDNRIEGNNCGGSDIGLSVTGAGNIIIRNTCSGNALNWSIVAGNALAPIVVATTNAAAVNGNAYAGNLGSTDPNANFTY